MLIDLLLKHLFLIRRDSNLVLSIKMLHMNYTNEYIIGTLFKRANLSRKIGLAGAKLVWLGCC